MYNHDEIINLLASDEYYMVKKQVNELINNPLFIKKIIHVSNPVVFDRFIKMAEYKIDTGKIYEKRNIFIKKVMDSINTDNCYVFFGLDNSKEVLVNRYIIEYIIGYFFQDNYYNFMTNFYQLISYLQHTNKDLVNQDHIKLYNEFIKLKDMSFDDKILFFKKHLDDNNIMEMFYDDINIVRKDSHKELVDHALKIDKLANLRHPDLSFKLGLDVYCLHGEEFYGFVRCLSIKSSDLTDQSEYVLSKKNRLGYSFSYISNNNIGTIDPVGENVTLLYDNIDYNNIMYVHHADLHSKQMVEQDDYLSNKENEIITPESLIAHTNNYNEIYIKPNEDGIKPSAIVCYDSISLNDVGFGKQYGLPILLIDRDKYKRYESSDEDYDDYSYVI